MKRAVYLDHHATTPCDPRVVETMLPLLTTEFGNAASRHHVYGRTARRLVEEAREQVAALLGCIPEEIIFTSGATESDNLAVKGVALASRNRGRHIVTSAIEHRAVLDACRTLEKDGFEVTYVRPGSDGVIEAPAVEEAIREDTILVSIMYANNEIGTINPVAEIGAACKKRGVFFHCDAVQAIPYLSCDVEALGVDLLAISGHKMYGPKGIGALYVRRRGPRVRLKPLLDGGGHERGLRSGTVNVPGAVGLGVACAIVAEEREREAERVRGLRDLLLRLLREAVPDLHVNGSLERRLVNNLNVSFPEVRSEMLLELLHDVAVSSGAACSSASAEESYVLKILDPSGRSAETSIRASLGRFTTEDEVRRAAGSIAASVRAVRGTGLKPGACS